MKYETAIIVLGGEWKRFKRRLATGLYFYNLEENEKSVCIVISGKDYYGEKRIRKIYKILKKKIDVYVEPFSRNTLENAKFSKVLLKRLGNPEKIYVITDDVHLPRTKLIFKKIYGNTSELIFESCEFPGELRDILGSLLHEFPAALLSFSLTFYEKFRDLLYSLGI